MSEAPVIAIIPARFGSTRLPGKPLAEISGKPMIIRVLEQVRKSSLVNEIYVATDDERILKEVEAAGGKAIMTSTDILTGTERCFSAYREISENFAAYQYLLNIQGDEPFIKPEHIDQLCRLISNDVNPIATLAVKIKSKTDLENPNAVKVVTDHNLNAIYFSRTAIPFIQNADRNSPTDHFSFLRHIGVYAFKTEVIPNLLILERSPLEKAENLEQLRWIENGYGISVGICDWESLSVDTYEDLERAIGYADSGERRDV